MDELGIGSGALGPGGARNSGRAGIVVGSADTAKARVRMGPQRDHEATVAAGPAHTNETMSCA